MSTPSTPRRAAAPRNSAIALLMVAGGLAAAMPVQAQIDPNLAPATTEAANKEIVPCVKNKTRVLAPCVKNRTSPGTVLPCFKTKTGAIAPCVKTKTPVAAPVGP